MGFKKILFGEKMPDKEDPKYKERYERDVAAGKSFAEALRLDKAAACVQRFATNHSKLFLAMVFTFVLFSIGLNLYRMSTAVSYRPKPSSAIERQEKELKFKRHHGKQLQSGKEEYQPLEIQEYEAYRQN